MELLPIVRTPYATVTRAVRLPGSVKIDLKVNTGEGGVAPHWKFSARLSGRTVVHKETGSVELVSECCGGHSPV